MLLALLLSACGGVPEFGGDDIDDFSADLEAPAEPSDSEGDRERDLQLTGREGAIDVVHSLVVGPCCAEWDLGASSGGAGVIEVAYMDLNAGACEDTCAWQLAYTIPGVPAGAWMVRAGDDEGAVEVP